MRISDWSSDVCSSDLAERGEIVADAGVVLRHAVERGHGQREARSCRQRAVVPVELVDDARVLRGIGRHRDAGEVLRRRAQHRRAADVRSEEHTSELQSLMRISYAVFCLKKKKKPNNKQ